MSGVFASLQKSREILVRRREGRNPVFLERMTPVEGAGRRKGGLTDVPAYLPECYPKKGVPQGPKLLRYSAHCWA